MGRDGSILVMKEGPMTQNQVTKAQKCHTDCAAIQFQYDSLPVRFVPPPSPVIKMPTPTLPTRKRKKSSQKRPKNAKKSPDASGSVSFPALATKPFPSNANLLSGLNTLSPLASLMKLPSTNLLNASHEGSSSSISSRKFARTFSNNMRRMKAENDAARDLGLLPGASGTASSEDSSISSSTTQLFHKMALPQCPINFQWDPEIGEAHKSLTASKMRLSPLAGKRHLMAMPLDSSIRITEFVWRNLSNVKSSREFATLVKDRFSDHMEIMRVIWLWVGAFVEWDASRVLHTMAFSVYDSTMSGAGDAEAVDESPEIVMRTRVAGSEGIANCVLELCRKCGIRAKKIRGYAKLLGYRPGQKLYINHVWNGICIEKKWYLLDVVCGLMASKEFEKHTIHLPNAPGGASRLNLHKVQRTLTCKALNDFYFMSPPKEFLIDHLPQMDRWQLMTPALPLAEFDQNYYMTPFASEHNLQPHNPEAFNNVIHTQSNYLKLAFYSPQLSNLKFMLKVTPLTATYEDHHYTVIQRAEEKKIVLFHMVFPLVGTYRVFIYVAENHRMLRGAGDFASTSGASISLVIPNMDAPTPQFANSPPKHSKLNYRLGLDYLVHAGEGLAYQVGFMRALVGWQSSAAALNPRSRVALGTYSNFSFSRVRPEFQVICPVQHQLLWRHTVYFKYFVNRKMYKEVALRMNPHQSGAPPDRRIIPWSRTVPNHVEGNIILIHPSDVPLVLPFMVQVEALKANTTNGWKVLTFYECVDAFERINHDRVHPRNMEEDFLESIAHRDQERKLPLSLQEKVPVEAPPQTADSDQAPQNDSRPSTSTSSSSSEEGDTKSPHPLSLIDFKSYTFADSRTHHRDEIMTDYAFNNNIVLLTPESNQNQAPCTSPFSVQLSTTSENIGFLLEVSRFDTEYVPLQNIEYFNGGANVVSFLLPMMQPGEYGVRVLGFQKDDPNSISASALMRAPHTNVVAEFAVRFIPDVFAEETASNKYYFQSQIPMRIFSPKIQNFPLVKGYKYHLKFRVENPDNYPVMMGDEELERKEGDFYETQLELKENMELHFALPHTSFFRSFFEAKPVNVLKTHYGAPPETFDAIRMKNAPAKLSPLFVQCGGKCVSHPKQTFITFDQLDCIKIMQPSKDYLVEAGLYNTLGRLPDQCVDVCADQDCIVIGCMYPRTGLYKLCIRLRSTSDDRVHDALHYWIEARGTDLYVDRGIILFGFPERLYSCPLGIRIYSPQSLFLLNRDEHNFTVRLDRVYASTRCALVMSNGDVYTLDQSPTDPFIFTQEILFDRDEDIQEATLHMYEREDKNIDKTLVRFFVLSPRMWRQYAKM